jgi:hypothetical protein
MYLKEIGKSATFPPPPLPTVLSVDPGGFLDFPDYSSPGPASSPIGWSRPHTANQNGGDLYHYDNETGKVGHMGLTISDFFYFYLFKVL